MTIATKARATSENFNNAFVSKTSADTKIGVLGLKKTDVDPTEILDVQDAIIDARSIWEQEVPSGLIDGVNGEYELTQTPQSNKAVMLYLNGLIQFQTIHYTVSGTTITMITPPAIGQDLYAVYDRR